MIKYCSCLTGLVLKIFIVVLNFSKKTIYKEEKCALKDAREVFVTVPPWMRQDFLLYCSSPIVWMLRPYFVFLAAHIFLWGNVVYLGNTFKPKPPHTFSLPCYSSGACGSTSVYYTQNRNLFIIVAVIGLSHSFTCICLYFYVGWAGLQAIYSHDRPQYFLFISLYYYTPFYFYFLPLFLRYTANA